MKGIKYDDMLGFYDGKRVFITGNTGFKGSWLTYILLSAGAQVSGYADRTPTKPNLYTIAGINQEDNLRQFYGDIRDLNQLKDAYYIVKPDIVFHLAAQPIVRESYIDPLNTYTTNVNGILNILECVRTIPGCRSFLNVTTDKVYKNVEWEYGYREIDPLDGFDPYSNSKSCSELITHSYKNSFFLGTSVAISTARAGNVIGGGDFSADRIIPDCVRAVTDGGGKSNQAIVGVRNPYSIRPYQHVLEALFVYLAIAMKQYGNASFASCYNVGPDDCDCVATGNLVAMFCDIWNKKRGSLLELTWESCSDSDSPHEANFLKLDCSKIKSVFGWQPQWHIQDAVEQTVNWTKVWVEGRDIRAEMDREIEAFLRDGRNYAQRVDDGLF